MKKSPFFALLLLAGCTTAHDAMISRPTARMQQGAAPVVPGRMAAPARIASSGTGKLAAAQAGNYMDAQESELRQRLRGASVRRMGDDILIVIGNDMLFDMGSTDLSPRAQQVVASMAEVLAHYNKTFVEVAGYTDTAGGPDANLRLSQARAGAVADMLVLRGVDQLRVARQGYGETHLKIPTGDNVNEPRNRRVEIRIIPSVAS